MDLNAIKNRLSQLQTTNTRTSNLWKPQPGTQVVRIVPYKFNPDNPFIELYFHYDLGVRIIFHLFHSVVQTQSKSLLKNSNQQVLKMIIDLVRRLKLR